MQPTVIERAAGLGWLAATPPDHPYRIAVTAPSAEEAVALLGDRITAWDRLGDPPTQPVGGS